MCLAVPGKIIEIDGTAAVVDMLGVERQISLRLTPDVRINDHVLVHAGFAIQVIDEQQAQETLNLLREIPELLGDHLPPADSALA